MSAAISPSAPTGASTPASATPAPTVPQQQPSAAASHFSSFRLTTFVDSNPKPKAEKGLGKAKEKTAGGSGNASSATQSPVVRPASVPAGGSGKDASTTNDGEAMNGTAPNRNEAAPIAPDISTTTHRRTASAAAAKIPTGQHNGFGVLDLTPPLPAAGQGKLGQHRDGRVRNPVPRKLKGKTDMRNGNFSVMHMDMSAHSGDKSGETRGEAAQRTSENTAKAAREALREKQGGGGGVKRRRVDGEGGWEPILSQASQVAALQNSGPPMGNIAPAPPKEIVHRTEMMTPEEVKYEQARLLTVLRSLNPLAVVDQMCTALAFFGGIPGAPPPDPGVSFPESEDANGNGALFVGWLSEIFPDAQRRQWSSTKVPEREASVVLGKRPRGRPKGSKASKVRKDKGIKKGRKDGLPSNASRPAEDGDDPADDDWVDIGIGDNEAGGGGGNTQPDGGMIIDLDGLDGTPSQAAGRRKPGRPRGSRNKEKEKDADGNEIPAVDIFSLSSPSEHQQQNSQVTGNTSSAFGPQQSPSQAQKRKPGRPPGSKTKPKEGVPPPQQPKPPKPSKQAKDGPTPTRAKSVLDGTMPSGLSADERAVLEAYRKNKALSGPDKPEDPAKKKRKSRAKPKPAQHDASGTGEQNGGEGDDTPTMLAQQLNTAPAQPTPQPTTTAVPPPPKRQRKTKESVAPASNTAKLNTSSAIDPSLQTSQPMSASPHLPQTQSQSQSKSRTAQQPSRSLSTTHATTNNPFASPPMTGMGNNIANTMMSIESMMPSSSQQQSGRNAPQGLEAHYERFANANQDSAVSGSPSTYGIGTHSQLQSGNQARASPSVVQGMTMQRGNSGSQQQQRGAGVQGMTRSPQKSGSLGGLSSTGMGSNQGMYYGTTQGQQGQQQQQQSQRHIPSQSSAYGYSSQNQQPGRSTSYNLDAFGGTTGSTHTSHTHNPRNSINQLSSSSAGQQRSSTGNTSYGVQSQNQGYFDGGNVPGAGFVDLPALETGGYGVPSGRAAYGNGNGNSGLFDAGAGEFSESEMRERLLRGMRR